jgi:response regulator RpfG family c-di-GMP phosphodiesterase
MNSSLLIVDDNPDNLLVLDALLGRDYELFRALSGKQALEVLEEKPVDAILLDIEMPGMDGYETTRRIKQIPRCQEIPIILISGVFTEDPYVKKGYEAGAIDYFTKPFNSTLLKQKVSVYASLQQKNKLLREMKEKIMELEELLKVSA